MIFTEVGSRAHPTVILLHGGGLSDWSWKGVAEALVERYHVVTPVIDGHGEDGRTEFHSIEDSAAKLIRYIQCRLKGKVYAIGGLSIGAQIVCEVLSREPAITEYAIVESALLLPVKGVTVFTAPACGLCYGLIKRRWFPKMQAKTLCVPDEWFERYYRDSLRISKQSLINMIRSNGKYSLKRSIVDTAAKVLILVGEREAGVMRKSASLLHSTLSGSVLYVASGLKHGELSLVYPQQYVGLLEGLFAGRN